MSGYMDREQRKPKAVEDIKTMLDCAQKAGISHALFINFGLLLGICRDKDFVGHDNDVDMCVQADKITAEQEFRYFEELHKAGMFAARHGKSFRKDANGFDKSRYWMVINKQQTQTGKIVRFTWYTLRKRKDRCKFCHWFMFPWGGYYWWSKSGQWVEQRKFRKEKWKYHGNDDAIMLGIPQQYIEELQQINFYGMKVNIPKNKGSVLDWEYPNWLVPRVGGSSKKNVVCIVGKWEDQNTWKIRKA